VKPEFYSDPELGRLSLEARYLYKGTWSFADDAGRLPADPRFLKSSIFPFDDRIGIRKVKALVDEVIAVRKIVLYEVEGVTYIYLPNFARHQKINRPQPAKYPPPPGTFTDDSGNGDEHSVNGHGTFTPHIGKDTKGSPPPGGGGTISERVDLVRQALLEEGVDREDLLPALIDLRAELTANSDRISSPVPWTRRVAESKRRERLKAEQRDVRPEETDWCDVCEIPIPESEFEDHVAQHEHEEAQSA
jgi:hypothetical protein